MISSAKFGILIGAVLAIVWFEAGFWPALFVAIAMAIGAIIGRILDGKLDVKSLTDAFRGKSSSS